MKEERQYCVYMMASDNRRALYVGVNNNLPRRVQEHKDGLVDGFTKHYHCVNLVYYDVTNDVAGVIETEKRFKKWRREKKDALVTSMNPSWRDLSNDILG